MWYIWTILRLLSKPLKWVWYTSTVFINLRIHLCQLFSLIVDGHWSSWGAFGSCSRSCGGGTQYRRRACNNPAPSGGGKNCPGPSHQSNACNMRACSGEKFHYLREYSRITVNKHASLKQWDLPISRNRGHSLLRNHISSARTADRERKNLQGFVWILKEKGEYLS